MSQKPLSKILYVEDEPDIQLIVKMTLESAGFTMECCNSGQEALQKVPQFSPDLILLDMMMPGMDGIQTMQELRKIPSVSQIPIIFVTAKVQKNEVEQYKKLGAIDVISKPFDPMSLANLLKEIWGRK